MSWDSLGAGVGPGIRCGPSDSKIASAEIFTWRHRAGCKADTQAGRTEESRQIVLPIRFNPPALLVSTIEIETERKRHGEMDTSNKDIQREDK